MSDPIEFVRADLERRERALQNQQKMLEEKRRELEIEIVQKAEEAAQANTYKCKFLTSTGQELRIPPDTIKYCTSRRVSSGCPLLPSRPKPRGVTARSASRPGPTIIFSSPSLRMWLS
jgi:hypothetical protein